MKSKAINCKSKCGLENKSLPGGGCAGGIGGCEVSILGILDGGGGSKKHLEVPNWLLLWNIFQSPSLLSH